MLAPISGVDVTLDFYRVAIDDRIVLSGNFTNNPRIDALLAPFGANSARFFTNAIDTRTNGVDLTAAYQVSLEDAGVLLEGVGRSAAKCFLDLRAGEAHSGVELQQGGTYRAAAGPPTGPVAFHRTLRRASGFFRTGGATPCAV